MMDQIKLKVKRVLDRALLPTKAHADDACFDLRGYLDQNDGYTVCIRPSETVVFRSGMAFEVPTGYVLKIHVRSSVGIKRGLVLSNGTGIIDAGFRGEVSLAITNIGHEAQFVVDGERLCQCEICRVLPTEIVEVEDLSRSERGAGGIGSTGRN